MISSHVYHREHTLGTITLVLGILGWLLLIVGTVGFALIALAIGFLVYLFMHSALIAHIKGNGVELSEAQFPDLHAQFVACCERLKLETRPQAYVLNGNGGMNAFATKFLKTEYVVLLSDVVDAMDKHPDGVRFYLGHELGHLRMKHISGHFFRWPALWLPLLGAAYSRARESTCDRHGLACSTSPENAARALAALAAGSQRWQQLDLPKYMRQVKHTTGFWMSFHELTAAYPWLTKRVARVINPEAKLPERNGFAYAVAALVPFAGRLGGGFGFLILVYIIGVLAAIAIPAYADYTGRTRVNAAIFSSQGARDALGGYYQTHKATPQSLEMAGVAPQLPDGSQLQLEPQNMVLTVVTRQGELVFTPNVDDQGRITWACAGGEGMRAAQLPAWCKRQNGTR